MTYRRVRRNLSRFETNLLVSLVSFLKSKISSSSPFPFLLKMVKYDKD